jgi:hypothetical protein
MTFKTATGLGLLGLLGLTSIACGASTMIGDVDGSAGATASSLGAGGSGTCAPQTDPNDRPFTPPPGVPGTWTGYFEGTMLAVGDDAIKLTIDQAGDGSNQIHIVFGSKPAPAPATSATDVYPPDAPAGFGLPQQSYMRGFSYTGHEVQWFGQRLKFGVNLDEAWDSWCKLQQSYWVQYADSDQRSYACVPGNGWNTQATDDGGMQCLAYLGSQSLTVPVNCTQLSMCEGGFCTCDECGCAAPVGAAQNFDITFDTDPATGTGYPANVGPPGAALRLTRAAN